ncbi:MAG: TolC family protein [Deltaproteobacteria bacterium]|nr:TolC family protein [Deltaproteobacteria bacterium]
MPQFLAKKNLLIFIFCFFLIPAFTQAQGQKIFTFEDCVQEVSLYNPDLAVAEESVKKAVLAYNGSYIDFVPKFSGMATYGASDSDISSSSALDASSHGGVQHQVSVGPSVQQNLFSGFKSLASIEKSRADLEAAQANLALVKTQVSFNLKTAFYRLLFAQEELKLTESIVPRREQNLKLVNLRYEVGRENKGSYLRTEAQTKQAEFEVLQARQNLKVARAALLQVLGSKDTEDFLVKGNFKTTLPSKINDFEALAKTTPSFLQSKAQVDSAKSSTKIAKSGLYPSLDATASFSRVRNDTSEAVSRWAAGVNLSYPFFSGGKTYFDVKGAEAEHRRSVYALQSVQNGLIYNLQKTYSDFVNAIQSSEVQKKFLESSLMRAEIARSQYANGLVSFQDWDLIESDLINTQKSTLSSLNDAVLAEAAWEQAQGKGVIP